MSNELAILALVLVCVVIAYQDDRITALRNDLVALQRDTAEVNAESAQLRSNVELLIAATPPSVLATESLSTGRTLVPLAKKIGEKNGPQQR